ncbi:hypothetical protein [Elizabethkingia meningoseptica]|uniref:hypothetical protein n=1 Tax=Elizabethkingia meningoseptica TaxID=238 RepID=UPI0011175205|nr:hypothetical protein [Elizabethkingia meningoseptica]
MRKKLLFAPLWGIFALSLLSSCRTEDGAISQKQVEDKRFAVFVPKDGKSVNYANGFAYLMKQYDNLHKTNLSGINNKFIIGTLASTDKTASLLQNGESYVEFNVRSQIFNGENGDKWIIFPRVQGNKVVGLVYAVLTEKETKVSYVDFNKQEASYKECEILFQEGLDRLRKRTKLNISASIKPVAVDTDKEWPTEIQVEDVSVPGRVLPNPGGGSPGGGCIAHSNCINPGIDSGGGDGSGGGGGGGGDLDIETDVSPNFRMKLSDQRKYLRFTEMVKGLKSYVQNNSNILESLVKISGLTKAQVLDKLTFGKGPSISIVSNLKDKNGNVVYGKFVYKEPNSISINETYVSKLENASTNIDIEASTFLLAVTVLHEFVHYGNNATDSFPAGGKEAGKLFENEVYGVVITEENATDYIISFKNK